jgi:hypothetical protein
MLGTSPARDSRMKVAIAGGLWLRGPPSRRLFSDVATKWSCSHGPRPRTRPEPRRVVDMGDGGATKSAQGGDGCRPLPGSLDGRRWERAGCRPTSGRGVRADGEEAGVGDIVYVGGPGDAPGSAPDLRRTTCNSHHNPPESGREGSDNPGPWSYCAGGFWSGGGSWRQMSRWTGI